MKTGFLLGLVLASAGLAAHFVPPVRRPLDPLAAPAARRGEEIAVAGALYPIGTRVVLWSDPGGYDANKRHRNDRPEIVLPSRPAPGCGTPERIGRRRGVETADDLRAAISQFVIHYDEAWTARNCFHVLHDVRGLSVHFLLDLDGTLYQTCDLMERCRHARDANDRSVGVEIAHPGALEDHPGLETSYRLDEDGPLLVLPSRLAGQSGAGTAGAAPDFGFRTPRFVPRPARSAPIRGTIQGRVRTQWDFTNEQYEALARLAAGLARVFPRVRLDAPRDAHGRVTTCAFASPEESALFEGLVGHYHLTTDKTDPGPAFDWERVIAAARRHAAGRP